MSSGRSWRSKSWGIAPLAVLFVAGILRAQTLPSYNFDDAGVRFNSDFVLPETIDLCEVLEGAPVLIPLGGPESGWESDGNALMPQLGRVILQNDNNDLDADADGTADTPLGLCVLSLRPTTVGLNFPNPPRNYKVQGKFYIEVDVDQVTGEDVFTNEVIVFVRARVGVNNVTFDTHHERIYAATFLPQGALERDPDYQGFPELFDGAVSLVEFSSCHGLVDHPEWPNARPDLGANWATGIPTSPILTEAWNWFEVSVQGNDDGGSVLLEVRFWPDGQTRPAQPLIRAWDLNGFVHTPETRNASNQVEFGMGTSWHLHRTDSEDDLQRQQFLRRTRVDEITFTALQGCPEPPVTVTRTLPGEHQLLRGQDSILFNEEEPQQVTLTLSNPRPAGTGSCAAAANTATIIEQVPSGWTVANISHGGSFNSGTRAITWQVNLSGGGAGGPPVLSYSTTPPAGADASVSFRSEVSEPPSEYYFLGGGDETAVNQRYAVPISDIGSIQHWLILGPYEQCGGAAPGEELMRRDYLTDGVTSELDIVPRAGDTINTNYRPRPPAPENCSDPQAPDEAASLSLLADDFGRNPGGVPTWLEWRGLDDDDDRIAIEEVYGDRDSMMTYGVTYLNVEEDTTVNFGVSSDDGVQLLLDGVELHINNTARPGSGLYEDIPSSFPSLGQVDLSAGQHTLMVKVFEGGGGHDFNVGFVEEDGFGGYVGIPGGPEGISISLIPAPRIRSITNNSGSAGQVFQVEADYLDAPGLQVTVCGASAQSTLRADGRTLDVTAPGCAQVGCVEVKVCTVGGCDSEGQGFCYTTTVLPPVIASIQPDEGQAGTRITITGQNFDQPELVVRICGAEAAHDPPAGGGTSVVATAPACAQAGFVEVQVCTSAGCDSEPNGFRYVTGPGPTRFVRGDANSSGDINLTDGVFTLNFLFLGGPRPTCMDAADSNDRDNANPNITDGVYLFNWLFLGGPVPPPPTPSAGTYQPGDCGADETPDDGIDCLTAAEKCQ